MKKSEFVPDLQPLKRYIEVQYQQSSSLFEKEFNSFLNLRKCACEPSVDYTGLSQLKRYYAQLQLLKGRFHFSAAMCTDVTWKWQDIFSDCLLESSDIRLEEASIMYNIAALHSILGVKERRADADSMKIACTHFQCASWALNTLVERHLPVSGATDLTSELMLLFGSLMLAQAQECVVEKSILDNRPANVTAKLSQYIMEVYENIGAQLLGFDSNDKLVLPKYSKEWRRRCQIKTNFYSSLTAYYAGINEEENKVYGKAIAWFQLANNHMEECKTNAKNFKDSDNLSMMASGGTYRASAIYAGEVISNNKFLSTLYLDSTKMLAPDPPFPQSLYNLFARMDAVDRDPSGELSKQLKSLVNLSVDGDSEFENLSIKMKDVEEFFNILVTTKGSEKTKNFSVIVKNFNERFKNLSDANQQAKQSNIQLKELITNQLKSFDDTLKISLEEFIKKLPSVNDLINDSTLNNISKESQRLFDKVNEMRQQRIELINKLRTNLHIDDVDSDLIIISDQDKQDLNSWFENRLKTKHDHLVNIIKQNLKAQENIQSALIDLNAEFAPKWTELSEIRTKGPMTYTPLYNSQQFPTTGVNIQPTAVPMPGSSSAAGFQTTNPMKTAVRPSPTVTYGAPQAANMVNPLVPPCQRPITSLPQTTNIPPSQPNNLSGTFESRFLLNNPRIPVLSSTTTSSLSQFPIPVNSRFSQPNNFIQTSIRSTNPLVAPNYSSTNSNQLPPQSVWPNQSINSNLTYQNPPQNYSKTLPTENFNMVGIQYPQSNLSFPNTLSYQKQIPHINNSPVNPGQISIASQQSYTTLPNHSQSIHPVSQCNTNVTTQSLLPTNVTQTYPTSLYPVSNSNNSTEQKSNQIKPFNSVLDTDNDAYSSSSRLKSMSPIQPQVLTKDDLDAKLREERLREAYSGNPNSPSIPSSTSNLIKSLSSSSSSNPTTVSESKNSSLNPVKSDSLTSSIVTSNPVNCQSVLSKFPPPELLSDPLVLNRFIASAELLLTWLENPNELISTGDSDYPVTSLSNLTNTNTITRLKKAWQKVQTLANAFTTSVYFNDNNRVVLKSLKNDYINASHIDFQNNLGIWCPRYIITQVPMIKTMIDFWTMILEQSCEIIVTLIPTRINHNVNSFYSSISSDEGVFDDENDPLRIPAYLPVNKIGARLLLPGSNLEIRLQSIKQSYIEGNVISQDNSDNNNNNNNIDMNDSNRHLTSSTQHHPWTERIITVQDLNTKITRSLVHLTYHHQFPLNIPLSDNKNSSINDPNIVQLVAFINHVHSYYKQQRNLIRPIAVVCEYGAELSGIFVTASVGILHADMLGRMSDVFTIAGYLCQQRHGVLNNSCQLYTAARLIGYSAIETVAKKDIVIGPRHRPSSTITTTTTLTTTTTTTTTNNSKTSNSITNSAQFNLTNSLDNIFSKQSSKSLLISVVDKWSVSTKSESITSSSVETEDKFNEMPVNVEQQQPTNELNVNPSTIVSLSDNQSNLLSQSSEINKSKLPEHLVNLNNLTKNSTNNKRYTRQDFEDLSNSTTTNTTELYHHEFEFNSNDDPLNKLDPLWNSKLLDHSVNS
ncbi:tyrosine-protein phosphatase non-receptor type 23 [Schistosoma bovis]|uniref:Tyrosine-protein phosphatase non-receptor type 23 n=1 Tax=Schistosoma bovis TaxID=6184 RepID=A0A430QUP3_SCHBO|nr:tyrosine-protein phosphatase non-receptor type 23 [Schistosoma bovis]